MANGQRLRVPSHRIPSQVQSTLPDLSDRSRVPGTATGQTSAIPVLPKTFRMNQDAPVSYGGIDPWNRDTSPAGQQAERMDQRAVRLAEIEESLAPEGSFKRSLQGAMVNQLIPDVFEPFLTGVSTARKMQYFDNYGPRYIERFWKEGNPLNVAWGIGQIGLDILKTSFKAYMTNPGLLAEGRGPNDPEWVGWGDLDTIQGFRQMSQQLRDRADAAGKRGDYVESALTGLASHVWMAGPLSVNLVDELLPVELGGKEDPGGALASASVFGLYTPAGATAATTAAKGLTTAAGTVGRAFRQPGYSTKGMDWQSSLVARGPAQAGARMLDEGVEPSLFASMGGEPPNIPLGGTVLGVSEFAHKAGSGGLFGFGPQIRQMIGVRSDINHMATRYLDRVYSVDATPAVRMIEETVSRFPRSQIIDDLNNLSELPTLNTEVAVAGVVDAVRGAYSGQMIDIAKQIPGQNLSKVQIGDKIREVLDNSIRSRHAELQNRVASPEYLQEGVVNVEAVIDQARRGEVGGAILKLNKEVKAFWDEFENVKETVDGKPTFTMRQPPPKPGAKDPKTGEVEMIYPPQVHVQNPIDTSALKAATAPLVDDLGAVVANTAIPTPLRSIHETIERLQTLPDVVSAAELGPMATELGRFFTSTELMGQVPGFTNKAGGLAKQIWQGVKGEIEAAVKRVGMTEKYVTANKQVAEKYFLVDLMNKLPEEPYKLIASLAEPEPNFVALRNFLEVTPDARPWMAQSVQEYFLTRPDKFAQQMGPGKSKAARDIRELLWPDGQAQALDEFYKNAELIKNLADEPAQIVDMLGDKGARRQTRINMIKQFDPTLLTQIGRHMITDNLKIATEMATEGVARTGSGAMSLKLSNWNNWRQLDPKTKTELVGDAALAARIDTTLNSMSRFEPLETGRATSMLTTKAPGSVKLMEDIIEFAPDEMNALGRRFVEDILDMTDQPRPGQVISPDDIPIFSSAAMNKWNKLSAEQKALYFGEERTAQLSRAFSEWKSVGGLPKNAEQAVAAIMKPGDAGVKTLQTLKSSSQKLAWEEHIVPSLKRNLLENVFNWERTLFPGKSGVMEFTPQRTGILSKTLTLPRATAGLNRWKNIGPKTREMLGISKQYHDDIRQVLEGVQLSLGGTASHATSSMFWKIVEASGLFGALTLPFEAMMGLPYFPQAVAGAVALTGTKIVASKVLNSPKLARLFIRGTKLPEVPPAIVEGIMTGRLTRSALPAQHQRLLEEFEEEYNRETAFPTASESGGRRLRVPSNRIPANQQNPGGMQ